MADSRPVGLERQYVSVGGLLYIGPRSSGNIVLDLQDLVQLLPGVFATEAGGWGPIRGSHASRDWSVPTDPDPLRPFFDATATFRGAVDPSGEDWTLGWTAYPAR
jgi:hypothetical protein